VPERQRPPAKPGKVAFRVYPWAEVFYRGKSLGVTPIAPVETPPGPQSFILKNPQLSQEKEVHVSVPSGGTSLVKYDFFKR
jgi:serine/threonine-protein kinase